MDTIDNRISMFCESEVCDFEGNPFYFCTFLNKKKCCILYQLSRKECSNMECISPPIGYLFNVSLQPCQLRVQQLPLHCLTKDIPGYKNNIMYGIK